MPGCLPQLASSCFYPIRLLGEIVVAVMMMVVVVMAVNYYNHLRLRRIRKCEAEDENHSKQILFHDLSWLTRWRITELH